MTDKERIDSFWFAVQNSWDIEPREYFEREAPKTGNWSPEAMAVHHMWKRDRKPAPDLRETPHPLVEAIRTAVANYMRSEGCGCCRDDEGHAIHKKALAELLNVEMYDDKSGYNFCKYRTKTKT